MPIFTNFHSILKNIFVFEENEYDTHFLNFSSFIQNKTLSYYEKGNRMKKYFFCIFFQKFRTHFSDKSERIFRILMTVMKFINTKQESFFQFLIFLTKITTHVYLLYYQPVKET